MIFGGQTAPFGARNIPNRRSSTSCVDWRKNQHRRIPSRKVTAILRWRPISGIFALSSKMSSFSRSGARQGRAGVLRSHRGCPSGAQKWVSGADPRFGCQALAPKWVPIADRLFTNCCKNRDFWPEKGDFLKWPLVSKLGSLADPTFRTERNAQSAPNFCKTGPKKPPKCEKWVPNWHQFWGHLGPPGLRRNLSCAGYYSSMAPKWRRGCWPSWLEARPASAPHLGSRVRIPADPRVPRAT